MSVERRDYFAANVSMELKEVFFVPYTMPAKCPPNKIGKRGTDIRFTSREAAFESGLDEREVVDHNESAINEWKTEKKRIEEILWRYNYADYMIKYGKTDLS